VLLKNVVNMKKFLFVSVCLLAFSVVAFSQQREQRTPEENAKRMTERMTTELKLTQQQIAPVDSINLVFAKAQAKLFEKANGDRASVRDDMQKLNALRLEAYEKVLTKEQMDAYKKMMEDMRNRGGNRGGGGGGNRPGNAGGNGN
jgi:LAS superfamily LD-carboxypeptidase LdcB